MKTLIKKTLSFFLCIIMVFTCSIPAMAAPNSQAVTTISESIELEYGTMYLEENSEYRIVYIMFDSGYISYSTCYKNSPNIAYTGHYSLNSSESYAVANVNCNDVVRTLLDLDPDKIIDFSTRPQTRTTILSESAALEFAANYGPGFQTPTPTAKILGMVYSQGISVSIYEIVKGIATAKNVIKYYAGDTLVSLASLIFGLNLTKIMNIVTNVFDGASDYVAQVNGTLTYYHVDNGRTKIATIDGQTYYWAGWDMIYSVYSGDKGSFVEVYYNHSHSDYNNLSYFAQKAIDSYNSYNV